MAVPWLRRSVASLSPRSLVFHHRSFHVKFVMDKVALAESFLTVLLFRPVIIIPPMVHTYLHLNTTGRSLGPSKKHCSFGSSGALGLKALSLFFRL
jgi:hypothetical protein